MSFTWKSASRRPPRRRPRSPPRMPRSKRAGSTTPPRSAFPRCERASAGTIATPTAVPSILSGSWSRPARPAAFILAFLAMFEPGDRVAVTVPGYPPYRHILTALGCEPVLIETSSETRHALTGEALLAAHRKTPLEGRAGRQPGQSDRHHDVARGAHQPDRARRKAPASASSPTRSITASTTRFRP